MNVRNDSHLKLIALMAFLGMGGCGAEVDVPQDLRVEGAPEAVPAESTQPAPDSRGAAVHPWPDHGLPRPGEVVSFTSQMQQRLAVVVPGQTPGLLAIRAHADGEGVQLYPPGRPPIKFEFEWSAVGGAPEAFPSVILVSVRDGGNLESWAESPFNELVSLAIGLRATGVRLSERDKDVDGAEAVRGLLRVVEWNLSQLSAQLPGPDASPSSGPASAPSPPAGGGSSNP